MASLSVLVSVLLLLLCDNIHADSRIEATIKVFGFEGASQAAATGHTLKYTVKLGKCKQITGHDNPDFVDTFGGNTITYRTFNDHEMPGTPFFEFHDQRLAQHENAGNLVRLTRSIRIYHNDTAEILTQIYSADWAKLTTTYSHECALSLTDKQGDVDFMSSDGEVTPLLSFEKIIEALEMGNSLHMSAMTFLCPGGRESSFSTFGGHIQDYEIKMDDVSDKPGVLKTSLQSVVHYGIEPVSVAQVLDVLHLRFHSNHTVEIVDTRARPPTLEMIHEHVSYCPLNVGAPGGMVHVYARN